MLCRSMAQVDAVAVVLERSLQLRQLLKHKTLLRVPPQRAALDEPIIVVLNGDSGDRRARAMKSFTPISVTWLESRRII